jgi:heme-binding NEAT domain protein
MVILKLREAKHLPEKLWSDAVNGIYTDCEVVAGNNAANMNRIKFHREILSLSSQTLDVSYKVQLHFKPKF